MIRSAVRCSFVVALVGLLACAEDTGVPAPTNLPEPPTPLFPSTPAGVALGRRLFFDPQLSGGDRIACASCHSPTLAFADGVARSAIGATGVTLERNAPGLTNVAWATSLFWDGGSKNLESLVLAPITNPDEMGQSLVELVPELAADPTYVAAFEEAYPEDGLVIANVMRALSEYMRTLVSATSRYDRAVRGEGVRLRDDELRGRAVYQTHCARCHATDLFTDHGFHDDGLDDVFPDEPTALGRGRARVTAEETDLGKYRTPTLRNLGYTAPYMHDGRFATLDEVIDHYRFGMRASPNLDPGFARPDGSVGIDLEDDEVEDLLTFLRTLDDPDFVERSRRGGR